MKNIFKNVIEQGGYNLETLLKKIDTYYIEGRLTLTDKNELYALARKTPAANYNYATEIEKLWAAIRELKNESIDNTTIADFVQPTGAHDAYQKGVKVKYNGKVYTCLLDNCVWSPDVLPSAWQLGE